MKNLFIATLIVFLSATGFAFSCSNTSTAEKAGAEISAKSVEVYYFHRNRRCGPCTTIENLTRKTLETHFRNEMEKGEVVFSVVNIEREENRSLAQKFNIASVALMLNENEDGKDNSQNLTAFAYRFVRNEESFISGLKEYIDKGLGR